MKLVAVAVALALAAGCGGAGETTTVTVTETATEPGTTTMTETQGAADEALPAPVVETRTALLEASSSGDYEALRPLVPDALNYTFGEATPGGAIEFWQRVEREAGDSPIRILADVLRLPPTYFQGVYVWPFAYSYTSASQLTPDDRELLRDVGGVDLSDDFGEGTGYLGWRTGIAPDGTWMYFIAGD